jgi:hypothetical protein
MGQISQIGQRVSDANSRGVAQAAELKGNGLGQPNASRGRSFLSNALVQRDRPDRDYSLRDLRDLPNLRPGSIGAPPACSMASRDSESGLRVRRSYIGGRVGTLTPIAMRSCPPLWGDAASQGVDVENGDRAAPGP